MKAALEAEAKVGLKMNIEERNLARLLKELPALRRPTISNLSQPGWVAVETIIDSPDLVTHKAIAVTFLHDGRKVVSPGSEGSAR